MPKYGLLTSAILPITDQINEFSKLGFDYVEIGIEEPFCTPELLLKQKKSIVRLLRRRNMFAVGHTAYWVQFGSSHREIRKGWIREAKHMINTAHALNIKYLNFHFYGGSGQSVDTEVARKIFLNNFAGAMNNLVSFSNTKGITLMLENTGLNKKEALGMDGFSYVIKKTPGLMVHLDIGHAFVEGGMSRVGDYVKRFQDKIVHTHMHDNHGKEDEHLPLGKGKIDFKRVVGLLKKINYNGTITFEVFTSSKDAVSSKKKLERLWER